VDKEYGIHGEILCWKNRVYVPKGLRKRILESEHVSKVARHFRADRTMELISRNFYLPNMEKDIWSYCNEHNDCQRTKGPRQAKHALLHQLEMACKPWTHISTNFVTDRPESEAARMILVVVDPFTKMADCIPINTKNSALVTRAYLKKVGKYHRSPEDVVSDQDRTFTGQILVHLSDYWGIQR
jgi:hypothetical protein